jgi:hypothetical protein
MVLILINSYAMAHIPPRSPLKFHLETHDDSNIIKPSTLNLHTRKNFVTNKQITYNEKHELAKCEVNETGELSTWNNCNKTCSARGKIPSTKLENCQRGTTTTRLVWSAARIPSTKLGNCQRGTTRRVRRAARIPTWPGALIKILLLTDQ